MNWKQQQYFELVPSLLFLWGWGEEGKGFSVHTKDRSRSKAERRGRDLALTNFFLPANTKGLERLTTTDGNPGNS